MTFRSVALVLALSTALTGCGGSGKKTARSPSPSASASPSPSPSVSPSPSPSPSTGPVSPFTGLPADLSRRVLAMKIDNAPLARPQAGLEHADVVYEEVVEGRTTRFLAIYSTQDAPVIGPVRSVRENDMELLSAYGRVLFGFSGGNTGVKRQVARADVINVSFDAVPSAYYKAGRRRDAINYMTSYARITATRRGQGATPRDVGFVFGDLAAGQGRPVKGFSVTWSRYARTAYSYDPKSRKFFRYMDNRPSRNKAGRQLSAPTVVVQYVTVRSSRYTDVNGARSPYTVTTGRGRGTVFRDGRAIDVNWSRAGTGPTRYVDASGNPVPFKPGPVWILLVPSDTRAVAT